MGRLFATALLAAFLAGPTLADTVIDLPQCVGPMPPDRSFDLSLPADMQDVESLEIHLVGACFQGLMVCDAPPAFPIWIPPQFEVYWAGPPVDYFQGRADEASVHGPFDVTFTLSPLWGTEPSQLAGQTVTFSMGLWLSTIPVCYVTEEPTAIIDAAQLRLVHGPVAGGSQTWSAVKALYR
jgi:hypothetical protein